MQFHLYLILFEKLANNNFCFKQCFSKLLISVLWKSTKSIFVLVRIFLLKYGCGKNSKRALCSAYSPGHQTTCALAILFLFAGIHLRCVDSDSLVHLVDFRMNSVLLPCTDLEFHLVRYDELYCHPFLQCLLDYKEVRIFDFLAPTDLLQLRGTSFATLQEFNDWAREQHSATQSAPQDGCR